MSDKEEEKKREIRPPSMVDALIPIVSLIILLGGVIFIYGDEATAGPTQVALLLCTMIAGLVGLKNGHRWEDMGHAAVEDSGTITSPLVPWNSCGAYMSATLGIATMAYFPYSFFNLINVIISFAYALVGFQIRHLHPQEEREPHPEQVALYGVGNRRSEPTTPEAALPGAS